MYALCFSFCVRYSRALPVPQDRQRKAISDGRSLFYFFSNFTGYQITSKFKNKIMVSVMDSLGKDSIIVER